MRYRLIRLRFRRRIRKGQRQVEELSRQAEQGIDQHLFRRFGRLFPVRRFVIGWLFLLVVLIAGLLAQNLMLSGYYQTLQPVPGGIYNEGVIGRFTNANPIYATSDVDTTVSSLIFAGLFTYNAQNKLVGDLASGYSINANGTVYTVHLKPHLTWQDGRPLTSADVVFTYHEIQDPDAQSPLQGSWQGVTVSAAGPLTVDFKLQNPLDSFPYSLTNGIVPEHLLSNIPAADLRSANFNTEDPVGAGPFSWRAVQLIGNNPSTSEEQIALAPFAGYQGGRPKLDEFVVHAYAGQPQLVQAFKNNQLNGAEGLTAVPSSLKSMSSLEVHSLLLSAATMVFFKTSSGVLADQQVRQALVEAANIPQIISQLGYPTRAVREPLLMGQLGYNSAYQQPSFNLTAAKALLLADGWSVGSNGMMTKDGQPLTFSLLAADTPEYHMVVNNLQLQWQPLGVSIQPEYLDNTDFQSALAAHDYEAVLYGISIGVDPDVFVYWDSSQADIRSANRLNLSEFENTTADTSIEAGRTVTDPALRVIKYQAFLQVWQQEAPALGLYQPRLLYLTDGDVAGLHDNTINSMTDRLDNVQNWEIREVKVTDKE
jgi:peptide/nickel transport system substrate-binding protein